MATRGRKRVSTGPVTVRDSKGKEVEIGAGPLDDGSLKISDSSIYNLLREVVKQLKINNKILNEVHDLDVNEQDIK